MVSETSNQPGGSSDSKPQRQRRGRGGLGRGLGALIPDSEAEPTQQGRPLDILFPDLRGSIGDAPAKPSHRQRGGSARELLEPRPKNKNVSREAFEAGGAKVAENAGLANQDGHDTPAAIGSEGEQRASGGSSANVSRETSGSGNSKSGRNTKNSNRAASTDGEATVPHPSVEETVIVSRETFGGPDAPNIDDYVELQQVPGATFGLIKPDWIIPNLKQPRHVFDPDDLKELADSIAEVGVLQPVVLRRITDVTLVEEGQWDRLREALKEQPEARYELIMGERRWRASQIAGLEEIPAIIRTTEEEDLLRDALIENLHRVQLNPLEEAAAYSQLLEDFNCTQEELSKRVARSRPQIANTLRLLKLPASVQRQLAAGVLSAGHARALLSLDSPEAMEAVAKRIVNEGLSVRATEEQVKFGKQTKPRTKKPQSPPPFEAQRIADAVADLLETSVTVTAGAKRGKLIIEFADQSDLDRIAHALGADLS